MKTEQETKQARLITAHNSPSCWGGDMAVHVAEIKELEERMAGLAQEYRALLMLALEMALELRMCCNEDIHHEQVAAIQRRIDAMGLTPNDQGLGRRYPDSDPT